MSPREELHRTILRLALVSHVPAAGWEPSSRSSEEDIGGKRPPGGLDWHGDRELGYRQKSAEHFRRRLARCHTEQHVRDLLVEAQAALWAWTHTPDVDGTKELEPARDSFLWKCLIADDDRPLQKVKDQYLVSQATVYRYRAKYRGLRAPRAA